MNSLKRAVLTLLVAGSVFSFVGCAQHSEDDPAASKKAMDSQKATDGAPSLGNPKPSDGNGK